MSSSDFKRVEISEETKTEWTEKETLNLVEAISHYGDDWKRVSHQVVGRTEKECVAHFLKLPFGEQFLGSAVSDDGCELKQHADESETVASAESNKRMRLTPLADASNPIMAQVLSWLKRINLYFNLLFFVEGKTEALFVYIMQ